MFRFILFLLVFIVTAISFSWFKLQSLPEWYEVESEQQAKVVEDLSKQINKKGVGGFLAGKVADVMNGQLQLNETEFNALLHASLNSSRDGRKLIRISDAVNASINDDVLEIGAVVNIKKLISEDPELGRKVKKVIDYLPVWDKDKVYIAIIGEPIARNGHLAISEALSLKIGDIPIANQVLKQLGVPLHEISQKTLPLKYLTIEGVSLSKGLVSLAISPNF